jgi:hypothetical protein
MADMGQTLISDCPAALFREHSRTLVRQYWSRLLVKGVTEQQYPWDRCWADFCRATVERWMYVCCSLPEKHLTWLLCSWLFAVLAGMPLPPLLIQYYHDQLTAFIDAHPPCLEFYVLKSVMDIL